jgi:PAS domain S-box-containing protein
LSDTTHIRAKTGRTFTVLVGFVVIAAIGLLTFNVAREIRLLGSANSDNVQWSLAQTEVEFLEYTSKLSHMPVDLAKLRQRFDIFFSRITTIQKASVFTELRADPDATGLLESIAAFLEASAAIIDADDTELVARFSELIALNAQTRPIVRALANSGLEVFAQNSDQQRNAVAETMTQLAAALAMLIGVLALAIYYFYRLNTRIIRRESERRQTATRMNTVIGTSLDGVIVCDADGKILEFSPASEAIFGHYAEDVRGRDIGQIIIPTHLRDAHNIGMARMRAGGEKKVVGQGRVQLQAMHATGKIFPIEVAIQSATTDQGEIFIAFMRDISQRVADESELVAARDKAMAGEKMKTDFLATMSHEIRTPLNGLLGNMNLLRDTQLTYDQERYVGHMETSGRLLMSHISDVLDITRYDAGKLSTKSKPMDISALIQDIIDNQSSTAASNVTTLDWGWIGTPVNWIDSDHDRLQHVMINLIGNAVKFTKRGKVSVTIQTETIDETEILQIDIADTGPGMPKDLTARVFDDFVTGNTAYDRDVGGTGLGLSIAKRFVTALNGTIGVNSVVGEGSTFWVRVPLTKAMTPVAVIKKPDVRSKPRKALKILLVEDNEINRIVAREMLEADGHTVSEAFDGQEGLDEANLKKFDLILMDISMPVMDGRAATRAIRAGGGASSKSPIVALTANAFATEQESFLEDGMDGVLTKPLSRAALRNVLDAQAKGVPLDAPLPDLVDRQHVDETRESVGEAAFAKLRERFVSEVEDLLNWLRSDEPMDFLEIGSRSHKVAGSAAVFGAVKLRNSLREIEAAAKAGDNATIARIVTSIDVLWGDTKSAMLS